MNYEGENELAVLDGTADIIDQLDNGSFLDSSSLNNIIKLRGEHSLLSRNSVGDQEAVPLLRVTDQLDIQNLHQGLGINVASDNCGDCIGREMHRHDADTTARELGNESRGEGGGSRRN